MMIYRGSAPTTCTACAVVGLLLTTLPAPARADTDITLVTSTVPGVTCSVVSYDCVEPDAVQIYVDASLVADYVAGSDALTAPRAPCFDESQFGAGTHTITVEATCGGVETDDAAIASFINPPVGLGDVAPAKFAWSDGETVTVTLHAQAAGLDVAVDFGAVDTEYMPGDEVVTDLGGGDYQVEYTLSTTNATGAGTYHIPVEITSGTVTRTHWDAVTIGYTPDPTGAIGFQDDVGGDFVLGDLPTGTLGSLSLLTSTVRIDDEPGAIATVTGQVWSQNNLDGTAVIVNVHEAGTGGYASSEVWIANSVCQAGSQLCVADISLPLRIRPERFDEVADGDRLAIEISLGTYAVDGPDFTPAFALPTQWQLGGKIPTNSIAMKGGLTYRRVRQNAQTDLNNPLHPQYGAMSLSFETRPLRRVTIEILDTCGNMYTTVTQEDGSWQKTVLRQCAGTNYTIRAKPHAGTGVYRVVSRGFNGLTHHSNVDTEAIPANVTSHDWGTKIYSRTHDEYGEFSTFMAGIRMQEWAKPYLVGDAKVTAFPWLYFKYDLGVVGCSGSTSCYSLAAQTITVNGTASNPDDEDEWTLAHETFHWFQHMFMAALHGNTSGAMFSWAGAFGEGFASMMQGELLGTVWVFHHFHDAALESERVDFQGNFKEAGGVLGNWVAALPLDLYVTTGDQGSGGWSWRILWDFFDETLVEPETEFARYDTGSGQIFSATPTMTDFGAGFDVVGAPWKFKDVVVRYLGGNHMPAHPVRPDIDLQGGLGLDMTEFLDGMLCRKREEWDDMEVIVHDMMDFQAYNPQFAPPACL